MRKNVIDREIELEEKEILRDKFLTALRKNQFINELKGGLGEELKKNPSKVKIIKEPKMKRLITWLKRLFMKL